MLYGEQFLDVIKSMLGENKTPETVIESVDLFKLGFTVKQIAKKRALKEDTIFTHLSQSLEQGMLILSDVVEISEQEIKAIEEAILSLQGEQQNALRPIYDLFDGQYSYGILRCVRASLQFKT
jgi:ATP-dependent DNA helicase RecQ